MDILSYYYYNISEEPSEKDIITTNNTINYLKDNNYTDKEIIKILDSIDYKLAININDLPNNLWENSLILRDEFYYHKELHITSPAPYWDFDNKKIISPKFYLEMKIKYAIEDILKYYYKKITIDNIFKDEKKDIGAIKYLLKSYENIDFIKNLDFVLFLIDTAYIKEFDSTEIIDLKSYQKETHTFLKNKVLNASSTKCNQIIWR